MVTSSGKDPNLKLSFPQPLPPGEYEIRLSLSSTIAGDGQLYWQEFGMTPPFAKQRSVEFDVATGGSSQDIQLPLKAGHPVPSIRLDPGRASGTARITNVTVVNRQGTPVYESKF